MSYQGADCEQPQTALATTALPAMHALMLGMLKHFALSSYERLKPSVKGQNHLKLPVGSHARQIVVAFASRGAATHQSSQSNQHHKSCHLEMGDWNKLQHRGVAILVLPALSARRGRVNHLVSHWTRSNMFHWTRSNVSNGTIRKSP